MNSIHGSSVAIIGGGPAGLIAAEVLAQGGARVDVYDAMPSVGRKFLMAGKGGLNITHSEPMASFLKHYGARQAEIAPLLAAFSPEELRTWVHALGIETFVGTSGRVFPAEMKAAPLLRTWLRRLRASGVKFHLRHRWRGWNGDGGLKFETPDGAKTVRTDAVMLALGGGSWPKLGSDGAWVGLLRKRGVSIAPLRPANCGFDVAWSAHFRARFAGQPVKAVAAVNANERRKGEFLITATGIEGGLVYSQSAPLRDEIESKGAAVFHVDLAPGRDKARLTKDLSRGRGKNSLANHLRRAAGLEGVKAGLLRELLPAGDFDNPQRLASAIKALPIPLTAPRPLEEVISTAGGVTFQSLDNLMLKALPGVFCAGEMLDWEAPTGGYLLTACFATGRAAAKSTLAWLEKARPTKSSL